MMLLWSLSQRRSVHAWLLYIKVVIACSLIHGGVTPHEDVQCMHARGRMHVRMHALQKQIGCFNHRVVTLVAVKLKDSGYERFTLVLHMH